MYIDKNSVLHFANADKNFSAARFFAKVRDTIQETFLLRCVNIYTGYPSLKHMVPDSVSNSVLQIQQCQGSSENVSASGTKTHNYIAEGKTYHNSVRREYNKSREASPPFILKSVPLNLSQK